MFVILLVRIEASSITDSSLLFFHLSIVDRRKSGIDESVWMEGLLQLFPSDNEWWCSFKKLIQSMLQNDYHRRPSAMEVWEQLSVMLCRTLGADDSIHCCFNERIKALDEESDAELLANAPSDEYDDEIINERLI